jgi:hypothetical protein
MPTEAAPLSPVPRNQSEMIHIAEYFALAREREAIRRRRLAGDPWPWTQDRIFREWRFTNVHREHDRTTAWFREHVRSKLDGWRAIEATIAFRFFTRIETAETVKDLLLDGWDRTEAYRRLSRIEANRAPLWTGAYRICSAHGKPKLASTLDSIEVARTVLPARARGWGSSLERAHVDLVKSVPYVGRFMAYEVVSDLRWTPILRNAADIGTWANIGPGCARGLRWLLGEGVDAVDVNTYRPSDVLLPTLREILAMSRDAANWPYPDAPWELREAEHWACEVGKYVRCRDRGVRLRNRFTANLAQERQNALELTFD